MARNYKHMGRSNVALATLDMVPFQIKLVTFLSSSSSVFSQLGMSPAWYQMMDRHMVLATMALSTGNEDSLVSNMSSWDWTLAILSEIALAEMALSAPVITPKYLEAMTVHTPTSGLSWRQLPSSTASDSARFVMPPVAAE